MTRYRIEAEPCVDADIEAAFRFIRFATARRQDSANGAAVIHVPVMIGVLEVGREFVWDLLP